MSADVTTNDDGSSTNPASVDQRSRSTQRKWLASKVLVPFIYAVLCLSVLGATYLLQGRKSESPKPKPVPDNPPGKSNNEASNHSGNSEHLARVKSALERAQFEIDLADAKQIERKVSAANSELEQLIRNTLSDLVGKRIAGNEELFLRFRAFKKSVEVGKPNPATPLSRIERDSRNATGEGLQKHKVSLTRARTSLDQAFQFYTQRLSYLRKLRESAASLPPSEHTLQSAMLLHQSSLASRAEAAAEQAALNLGKSLDEDYSNAVAQRDESAALVKDLKSQLQSVTSGNPITSETSDEALLPQPSRDDYKRELDKIRTQLVAFTTPGYVQPESADKLVYRNVKQPMSYSALRRIGALNPTKEGRATLLRVGGSKSATQRNDRPLGGFPRMNSVHQLRKDKDLEARVNEAQQLLRRYGPLMVEDGLLLP